MVDVGIDEQESDEHRKAKEPATDGLFFHGPSQGSIVPMPAVFRPFQDRRRGHRPVVPRSHEIGMT